MMALEEEHKRVQQWTVRQNLLELFENNWEVILTQVRGSTGLIDGKEVK
jgi:hypothetical protein